MKEMECRINSGWQNGMNIVFVKFVMFFTWKCSCNLLKYTWCLVFSAEVSYRRICNNFKSWIYTIFVRKFFILLRSSCIPFTNQFIVVCTSKIKVRTFNGLQYSTVQTYVTQFSTSPLLLWYASYFCRKFLFVDTKTTVSFHLQVSVFIFFILGIRILCWTPIHLQSTTIIYI